MSKIEALGVSKGDDLDLNIDEVPDFEPNEYEYAVYVFGYNKDNNITDYEKLIKTFKDSEEAEKYAAELYDDPSSLVKDLPEDVKFIGIEVETVVDFGDYTENVETIYNRVIEIEK